MTAPIPVNIAHRFIEQAYRRDFVRHGDQGTAYVGELEDLAQARLRVVHAELAALSVDTVFAAWIAANVFPMRRIEVTISA